jgi:hypothetical protein
MRASSSHRIVVANRVVTPALRPSQPARPLANRGVIAARIRVSTGKQFESRLLARDSHVVRRRLFFAASMNDARVILLRHFVAEASRDGKLPQRFLDALSERADALAKRPEPVPWHRVENETFHRIHGDPLVATRAAHLKGESTDAERVFDEIELRRNLEPDLSDFLRTPRLHGRRLSIPFYVSLPLQIFAVDVHEAMARTVP